MSQTLSSKIGFAVVVGAAAALLSVSTRGQAPAGQGQAQGRGGRGQPPQTARAQAGIDLTGWWVSVVTEDWRWRMVTPAKGDYASVPLSDEGRRVADAWDPAKDERDGNACKAYGVGGIMRIPGRLHITWQGENTLKIETDAGMQTRVLHFPEPAVIAVRAADTEGWQGYSLATWELLGAPPGAGGGGGPRANNPPQRYGALKVVTTRMKPGYLRKNGVAYSNTATITEYFDRHTESNGDQWLTVTTIVEDPKYLTQPFITSTHFKKEADGSKWRPTPCAAR